MTSRPVGSGPDDGFHPMRELGESFLLIGLMFSSLSAYLGLGVLVVRLFATIR